MSMDPMQTPTLGSAFWTLMRRDLLLALRGRNEWLNPLLFFIMVVTLFPLGVGPEPQQLMEMAPGVIWVAALLSAMLSLDGIFRGDYDDGTWWGVPVAMRASTEADETPMAAPMSAAVRRTRPSSCTAILRVSPVSARR